jgi:hypothetical protein
MMDFTIPPRDPPDDQCRRCLARLVDAVANINVMIAWNDSGTVQALGVPEVIAESDGIKACPRDCWLDLERTEPRHG